MKEDNFLATFGSDEPVARVLYYYQKKKNLLRVMMEDLKDKKSLEFFKKQDLSLEKEIREFTQGNNLAMFEKIKFFIKTYEK